MNALIKYYILVLLLCFSFKAEAQIYAMSENKHKSPAFAEGEKLVYAVSYKVGFVNVDVATVLFTVGSAKVNGVETYHIYTNALVNSGYKWFFNLNDVYETWLDKDNLRPVYFKNNISEGDYKFKSHYVYNWDSMMVKTTAHIIKHDKIERKVLALSDVSYDAVSLFFNLRSLDMDANKKDEWYPLEVVFHNKVRKINYKYIGRDKRNVEGMGKVNALVFVCQLADSSGESFKDGSEFTIWISDDKNKIPLFVDSPIKVGSVKVRLISSSGLKY